MKKVTTLFFMLILIFCFGYYPAESATISGTAPQIDDPNPVFAPLNIALQVSFDEALAEANAELARYDKQTDLTKGFADANAFSSHAGTIMGYRNYDLFAISAGVMLGGQAPSGDQEYYTSGKIQDDLEEDGDLYAGVALGIVYFNIGIRAFFLSPDLYLNFKYGNFSRDVDIDTDKTISYETTMIGIGANYALIRTRGIGWGFLKWRGISVGSGFIYHKTSLSFEVELDDIEQPMATTSVLGQDITADITIDPSVEFALEMKTYIIPLEASTSIQLLWLLNVSVGAGIDFMFGTSDLIANAAGDVTAEITGLESIGNPTVTPGDITIDGSTTGTSPSFVRARVMASIGLQLGPVKVDVPLIYYFNNGAALGVTAAFVW